MGYFKLIHNIVNPEKFGKDDCGSLLNHRSLKLYFVVDGHSQYPKSSELVDAFCEFMISQSKNFVKLKDCPIAIQSFLNHLINQFRSQFSRQFIRSSMSIIIVIFNTEQIFTMHLGDCRLGKVINDQIIWLTIPHTCALNFVNQESSEFENQLRACSHNNILTRSLNTIRPYIGELNIYPYENSQYIIATDGVWKLDNEQIDILLNFRGESLSKNRYIDDLALILIESD